MILTVSGEEYAFSESATRRSSVLRNCAGLESAPGETPMNLPLPLEHVRAWDEQLELDSMSQELLLGVFKVRRRRSAAWSQAARCSG